MAERKDIEIFFRIEGLEAYITDLETLDSVLQQVNNATVKAKESTDKLEQSTESFEELERRLQAMEGGVKTLAGSLEFLAGAASLLGLEDNEFFKSLEENTLGVLALARGAIDVSEGYSLLRKNTELATTAQRAYNAVANANPYVLLGAAILALGGAVASYVIATQNSNSEQREAIDNAIEYNNKIQTQIDYERELAKAKGEFDLRTQLDLNAQEILQNEEANRKLQEQVTLVQQRYLAGETVNDSEVAAVKLARETIAANNEVNKGLRQQNTLLQTQIDAEKNREAERKKNFEAEEARRKAAERRASQAALEAELTLLQFEEGRERELEALRKRYEDDVKLAKGNKKLLALVELQFAKDVAAINAEYRVKEIDSIENFENAKVTAQIVSNTTSIDTLQQRLADDQALRDEYQQKELEAYQALEDAKINAASATFDILEGLAGDNEKLADAIFIARRAFEAAQVFVNARKNIADARSNTLKEVGILTTRAAAGDLVAAGLIPGTVAAGTAAVNAVRINAAASLAGILATSISRFKGGGGGGDLGSNNIPSPAVPSVNYSFQQQPGQSIIPGQNSAGQQGPIQAYVLVSDVNNAQQAQQQIDNLRKL